MRVEKLIEDLEVSDKEWKEYKRELEEANSGEKLSSSRAVSEAMNNILKMYRRE